MKFSRANIISKARILRMNMTPEEKILWEELRMKKLGGHRFRRQHPIGPYIVDLLGHSANLAIEIDGEYHNNTGQHSLDKTRQLEIEAEGIHVLRFTNREVNESLNGVLKTILTYLNKKT